MDDAKKKEVRGDFKDAINMAPKALEDWLESEESKSVGQAKGSGEAVGHHMGRRIVEIRRTKQADLTDDDFEAMQKVVGYVHRHLEQGGQKDDDKVKGSRWRYSLMNWGHDPLKD